MHVYTCVCIYIYIYIYMFDTFHFSRFVEWYTFVAAYHVLQRMIICLLSGLELSIGIIASINTSLIIITTCCLSPLPLTEGSLN